MKLNNPQGTILATCAVILTILIAWMIFREPAKPSQTPNYFPNYPLNMDFTSYLGQSNLEESFVPEGLGDKLISVFHSVTYDEKELNYVYNYRISFIGKQKCYLAWEVLDQILNQEKEKISINTPPKTDSPSLIALEPNVTLEFKLISNSPPILSTGIAWIYKAKELNDKNTIWELIKLNAQPGPLPLKFSSKNTP